MDILNKCLNDPRISWKAKGIFVYITNNPTFDFEMLLSISKDRITAIQNGLIELKTNGYLDRFAVRDDFGRFNFYFNIPKGYKISEEEAIKMSNNELLAYYHKTKEQFPLYCYEILINVENEIKKRGIDIKNKDKSQILMDKK